MSIRPLDMQVLVPKTPEVAHQKHVENNKSNLDQSMASQVMDKSIKKQHQKVVETHENEKSYSRFDAKDKGSQSYQHQKKKGKKPDVNKNSNHVEKGYHKIDIRI